MHAFVAGRCKASKEAKAALCVLWARACILASLRCAAEPEIETNPDPFFPAAARRRDLIRFLQNNLGESFSSIHYSACVQTNKYY